MKNSFLFLLAVKKIIVIFASINCRLIGSAYINAQKWLIEPDCDLCFCCFMQTQLSLLFK